MSKCFNVCECRLPCDLRQDHAGACDCGDANGHKISLQFWRDNPLVSVTTRAFNGLKQRASVATQQAAPVKGRLVVPLSHVLTLWWGSALPGREWAPAEVSSIQVDSRRLLVSLAGVSGVGVFQRRTRHVECGNCGIVNAACLKSCPCWRERERSRVVYDVGPPAPSVFQMWRSSPVPFIWARREVP